MPAGLLTLSFHTPKNGAIIGNVREDLEFLRQALASNLIAVDAMDQAGPPAPDLLRLPGTKGSGLMPAEANGTSLITFIQMGIAAWNRPAFQKRKNAPSKFDEWMNKVLAARVECLVLARPSRRVA